MKEVIVSNYDSRCNISVMVNGRMSKKAKDLVCLFSGYEPSIKDIKKAIPDATRIILCYNGDIEVKTYE